MLAGVALTLATGGTDAYTYLRHGHVFAEAMTGNLVLVGVGAADPAIVAFWRPLASFAAFLAGAVALTLAARSRSAAPAGVGGPQLGAIACQGLVLAVVGGLGHGFPQEVIVCAIACAAGMQSAAFRRLGAANLSTVVMTTNSTQLVGALLAALESRDRESLARSMSLLLALAGFLGGVFLGAYLSVSLHDHAAWVIAGLFLLAGLLHADHRRRTRGEG